MATAAAAAIPWHVKCKQMNRFGHRWNVRTSYYYYQGANNTNVYKLNAWLHIDSFVRQLQALREGM